MTSIYVDSKNSVLSCNGKSYRCALGKAGVVDEDEKREGDNKTPLGKYALRYGYYRPDVFKSSPDTSLEMQPIDKNIGWVDDVNSEFYNQPIELPFSGSHEKMWRDDNCYDLVIVIGHNDNPTIKGKGSAIFMHLAKEGYKPTEGCVALSRQDLLEVLKICDSSSFIEIA